MSNRWLVYLNDESMPPLEMFGNTKEEIVKLVLDSCIDKNDIMKIVQAGNINTNIQYQQQQVTDPITGELVNINVPIAPEGSENVLPSVDFNNLPYNNDVVQSQPVKYWEDCGISYKLENGIVYKKQWVDLSENPDFRILLSNTKKVADISRFTLQKIDWVKLA